MYSQKSLKKRMMAIFMCVVFLMTAVVTRLYYLQIVQGKDLQKRATEQWLRDLPLSAKRGEIRDRNGVVLASSYTVYDVYVRPALVEDVAKESEIYATVLNLDKDEIKEKIGNRQVSEALIASNVKKEELTKLIDSGIESFSATENWKRHYSYDSLLAQVLGFTTVDGIGQSGLEVYYDKLLSGVDGQSLVEGDAGGKLIEGSESYYIPPIDGLNIELTIDFNIQSAVETIMAEAIKENGSVSGSALVMNPKTGEILAVVTLPSVDLNEIDRNDTESLFALSRNFIISDTYEPGSTFKTIVAGIALDLGVVSIDSGFYCPGYMIIDGVRTNCHKKTGHGSQTLLTGFTNSCNCVFMQVARLIGQENFYKYLTKLGIDGVPKLDYPSVASALIIPSQELSTNDFYRNGFGHSIAISGLQLMMAISAMMTNGNLMTPYFLKSVVSDDGELVYNATPQVSSEAVSSTIVKDMQKLMENVVLKGGGKASAVEGQTVGGKTGTAQKYENGVVSTGKYIGSYICYSPVEDPRYAVLVLFDEPKSSIYGNIVATPVAGVILKAIYELEGNSIKENLDAENVVVPNLVGMTLTEAGSTLASLGFYYVVEGDGDVVSYQSLSAGDEVLVGSSIMIKLD